jgi:hypothetical protein
MTNFERWKQSLTSEDFVEDGYMKFGCDRKCPAFSVCDEDETGECADVFLRWANSETGGL